MKSIFEHTRHPNSKTVLIYMFNEWYEYMCTLGTCTLTCILDDSKDFNKIA